MPVMRDLASVVHRADLDGDGIEEVVIGRQDKTPRAEQKIILVKADAEPRETPFSELRDTDGDGNADAVSHFQEYLGDVDDKQAYLRAPTIVLHRTKQRTFALDDDVSRQQRRVGCHAPLSPIVASRASVIDQNETARRVVCSLIAGADRTAVEHTSADACALTKRANPAWDCDVFLGDLGVFMDRAMELIRWGRH